MVSIRMPAAVPSGEAPLEPQPQRGDAEAEPFLLEAFLADLREIRAQWRILLQRVSAEANQRHDREWSRLSADVAAAHERAERSLLAAASRDGLALHSLEPTRRSTNESAENEDVIRHFRRVVRGLEQQCTCLQTQADQLELHHLVHALGSWVRELIGLEQPLIRVHAKAVRRA